MVPQRIGRTKVKKRGRNDMMHNFSIQGLLVTLGERGAMVGSSDVMRSDVSTTVFLSDLEEYEGGELTVMDSYGAHEVKLPAGDAIIYPASSVHRVNPVTSGERVASFLWTQSMVRDDWKRTMLFELDQNIQKLRASHGDDEATVGLAGHYHNLLRMWADL